MTPLRRTGFAIVAVLALLLTTDTAVWYWITGRMRVEWEAWRVQAVAQGLQVQSAPPVRSGWPYAAELVLGATNVAGGLADWSADAVRLSLSPLHPQSIAIAVTGHQSVRMEGLPPVAITAQRLTAITPLDDPQSGAIEAHGITLLFGEAALDIALLTGRLDPDGLDLALAHLTIPAAGLPFGGAIDRASAHVHATVSLAQSGPGALQDPAAAARTWSRAGGQLVVDDAVLVWGPLDARAHVTAGLDDALQPVATGTLHLIGYQAAIDALVRAGTIGHNAARVATTILDMMASKADPAAVDVPLTLRNGSLAMGAIPLLRVPPFTWP